MDTKRLQQRYDKLDDMERFRLLVLADARGDGDEARALVASAARARYEMLRYPFAGMWDGLLAVKLSVALEMLHSAAGMFCLWHYACEDKDESADYWRTTVRHAERLLASWDGFRQFCDGLALDFDAVSAEMPSQSMLEAALFFADVVWNRHDHLAELLGGGRGQLSEAELEAIIEESTGRIQERRQALAREYAELLRQVWDKECE